MSNAKAFKSPAKPRSLLRPVLGPAGNMARISKSEESVRTKEETRKFVERSAIHLPEPVQDHSAGGLCSSDSSSSISSVSTVDFRQRRRQKNRMKTVKVVPAGVDMSQLLLSPPPPVVVQRRCAWITPNSDPLYVSFHDEEWGVPVHDDRRLFELLILSEALAELSWPTILGGRDAFRKLLDNFDPASIAKFTEDNLLSLKSSRCILLSELKLRAIVENAKQMLKVIEEFGSFNNYCWRFVNHKPIINEFRYARQVPVRTPKAEVISKDLMRRGFRCVGPTIIYAFMQAAGIVNDHLSSCFRYQECNYLHTMGSKIDVEETATLAKLLNNTCSLQA